MLHDIGGQTTRSYVVTIGWCDGVLLSLAHTLPHTDLTVSQSRNVSVWKQLEAARKRQEEERKKESQKVCDRCWRRFYVVSMSN